MIYLSHSYIGNIHERMNNHMKLQYYEKYKKGFLEIFFLKILSEKDVYGYELSEIINKTSNNLISVSAGNMYPVLYKLEEKGYISSYEKIVGKRMRRVYYTLTDEGRNEFSKMMEDYNKFQEAANSIMTYKKEESENL